MRSISDHDITEHGRMYSDYFQGAGVAHTQWDECFTGVGLSPYDALDNALDTAAELDLDVSTVENNLSKECDIDTTDDENGEISHFVTLFVTLGAKC